MCDIGVCCNFLEDVVLEDDSSHKNQGCNWTDGCWLVVGREQLVGCLIYPNHPGNYYSSISHLWKFGESSNSKFDKFQELLQVFVSGSVWCDVMHKIYHPYITRGEKETQSKTQVLKMVLKEGVSQIYLDIFVLNTGAPGAVNVWITRARGRVSGLGPHQWETSAKLQQAPRTTSRRGRRMMRQPMVGVWWMRLGF